MGEGKGREHFWVRGQAGHADPFSWVVQISPVFRSFAFSVPFSNTHTEAGRPTIRLQVRQTGQGRTATDEEKQAVTEHTTTGTGRPEEHTHPGGDRKGMPAHA